MTGVVAAAIDRETIINSAYCRFLCLISLHTACVNSYTFSAAQIQVIIFVGLLVQYIVIIVPKRYTYVHFIQLTIKQGVTFKNNTR